MLTPLKAAFYSCCVHLLFGSMAKVAVEVGDVFSSICSPKATNPKEKVWTDRYFAHCSWHSANFSLCLFFCSRKSTGCGASMVRKICIQLNWVKSLLLKVNTDGVTGRRNSTLHFAVRGREASRHVNDAIPFISGIGHIRWCTECVHR